MSDKQEAYDPTAPEGASSAGSQYMSKKDVRNILLVIVVMLLALFPIYRMMEKNSEKTRCRQNIQAIFAALSQYATEYDERFPAIYAMGGENEPLLDRKGMPFTWAGVISQYMNKRQSFLCPTAIADEAEAVASMRKDGPEQELKKHPEGSELLTYGMYLAYNAFPITQVENPNNTVVVAETSNMGARGTFDPMPFKDSSGAVVPHDAFSIGWDNSNTAPTNTSTAVTRLAFYNAKGGEFKSDGEARHDIGIHALTASGSLVILKPDSAFYNHTRPGRWAVPATLGR
jgi:hypothetical protein